MQSKEGYMSNLLIVDDEPTTLRGLSETIAWQ